MTKITASISNPPNPPLPNGWTASTSNPPADYAGELAMARAEGSSYARSSARRDECFAAIDALQDTIDSLRAALDEARIARDWNLVRADRYRAALEEIRDRAPGITRTVWCGELPASGIARLAEIARRALGTE